MSRICWEVTALDRAVLVIVEIDEILVELSDGGYTAVQSQKAVTAYFWSRQLLPFSIAERQTGGPHDHEIFSNNSIRKASPNRGWSCVGLMLGQRRRR